MAATRDVAGVVGANDVLALGVEGVCDITQSNTVEDEKKSGRGWQ